MPTNRISSIHARDDLRPVYEFDYAESKPNRFVAKLADTRAIVLQPDVAESFRSSEAVNDLLRSAMAATGMRAAASRCQRRRSGQA